MKWGVPDKTDECPDDPEDRDLIEDRDGCEEKQDELHPTPTLCSPILIKVNIDLPDSPIRDPGHLNESQEEEEEGSNGGEITEIIMPERPPVDFTGAPFNPKEIKEECAG